MGHTYSVWMYFQRDLPVGCANVLVGRVGGETEQFVRVRLLIVRHEGCDRRRGDHSCHLSLKHPSGDDHPHFGFLRLTPRNQAA